MCRLIHRLLGWWKITETQEECCVARRQAVCKCGKTYKRKIIDHGWDIIYDTGWERTNGNL